MSHRSLDQNGFSITELLVVIIGVAIISMVIFSFFGSTTNQFFKLQADGIAYNEITNNSQRIASVVRGIKFIETAEADRIVGYSYFAPNEQYTSKITYDLTNTNTLLRATVVPMTADYPTGTLLTAQTKVVPIVNSFYKKSGVDTFEYLDANGTKIPLPIDSTSINAIRSVRINLNVKPYGTNSTNINSTTLTVNLRNKKTNL
ncbi:MAG: hypothetical protein U0451_01540 [Candidatus Saccharimonadales bacterium]